MSVTSWTVTRVRRSSVEPVPSDLQKKAVEQFSEEIQRLTRAKQDAFVSEAYLLSLGKVINLFCTLDELKNIKASMKNDTALYKRSVPREVAAVRRRL